MSEKKRLGLTNRELDLLMMALTLMRPKVSARDVRRGGLLYAKLELARNNGSSEREVRRA